jgi:hypothetical protein
MRSPRSRNGCRVTPFHEIGAPEALQDSGRLAWSFGPPDDPQRITGLDVIVVNADRVAALYTFLNPARA